MSDTAYRPRSASEIVDAAFQLFKQHVRTLVLVTAVAYLPVLLLNTVVSRATGIEEAMAVGRLEGSFILMALLGMVWFGLVSAVVCVAASEAYLRRTPEPARTFQIFFSRAGSVVACVLVVTIAITIGFILLIVPGLYLYARYGMAPTIAVLEGGGLRASLARASILSNGRKGHILLTMFVIFLIFFAIGVAAGLLVVLIPSPVLVVVAGFVVTVMSYPMIALVQTVLYYDLRIRAEGYDLQLMSESLGPPADLMTGATA